MKEQCFLVEGAKGVYEFMYSHFSLKYVIGTDHFYNNVNEKLPSDIEFLIAKPDQLEKSGSLSSNRDAIAIVEMPVLGAEINLKGHILALDTVNDPGNLGAIFRIADWYGVNQLILSPDCADPFSPKVVNASMGSFTRVKFSQRSLQELLSETKIPVIGTFTDGMDIHQFDFPESAIIVIGNESHGISVEVSKHITENITIPKYGGAESLNAAMATAVILDNLRR